MSTTGEVRRVGDEVLRRIVDGRYPPGLRLPSEIELADQFACGRSTVREALRHLAGLGVVRSRKGSGALVLDFRRDGTPALLPAYLFAGKFDLPGTELAGELLHLRSLLAGEAVRLAARYARPGDLDEARRLLDASRALEADPVAHAAAELGIYRSIVSSSRVWPAVWLANAFWAPMREIHALVAPVAGAVPSDFHAVMSGVLDRVEAGDADGAADAVRRFFARVDRELTGRIGDIIGPGEATPSSARTGASSPAAVNSVGASHAATRSES